MSKTLFHSAVFMIVRDAAGRVLLHRRANTGFMDGYYDFPSGHVEAGESFTEAAVRELAEEVGLATTESDLQLVHLNQVYLKLAYINIIFEVTRWSGSPTIMEPNKCDDLQFFALDALPEKCTLGVRDVERAGFVEPPTISIVTSADFELLVGAQFEDVIGPS